MNKIKVNISLFILLFLSVIVLINDYLSFFININYYVGMIISTVFMFVLYYTVLRKIIKIELDKITYSDIMFFIVLALLFAITIVFPDRNYDSLNYHIYSQVKPFNSIINGDFFPSSELNSFTYSYGDRLFYIFRLLFGYRLGLIFNYLCLYIIYNQVKNIIKLIYTKKEIIVSIIATISVFTLSIIDLVDAYYTDFISLIVILEVISIILSDYINKDNILKYMYYVMLLFGLLFCSKISNGFFIVLFGIILLIKNRKLLKSLKIYHYLFMLLIFIFPFGIYMLYSYIETGNPFFPFYNTIFKSNYFPDRNWMDSRFGPKTIKEYILYPILIVIKPALASDNHIVEPMWAFSYIVLIIYNIYYLIKLILKKRFNSNKFLLCFIGLSSIIIWEKFVLGYTRYALFILIIGIIYCCLFCVDVINKKHYYFVPLIAICIIINSYYTFDKYVIQPSYITFNNIFTNGITSYKYNIERLFDHDVDNIIIPNNSIWGVTNANSGYMYLLNNETKMYSLRLESDQYSLRNEVDNTVSKYDNILTILDAIEIEGHINNLNSWGYEIVDIYDTISPSFLNYNNYLYIFKIKKNNNNKPNSIEKFFMKSLDNNPGSIEFYAGPEVSSRKMIKENEYIGIFGSYKGNVELLDKKQITSDGKIQKYNIDINKKYNDVYIVIVDDNNNVISNRPIIMFNYKYKEENNKK